MDIPDRQRRPAGCKLPAATTGEEMFCASGANLAWSGGTYFISAARTTGNQEKVSTEAVRGTVASEISNLSRLPDSLRRQLTRSGDSLKDDTDDGRFSLEMQESGCPNIAITSTGSSQPPTTYCAASHLLDRGHDLLYMILGGKSGDAGKLVSHTGGTQPDDRKPAPLSSFRLPS